VGSNSSLFPEFLSEKIMRKKDKLLIPMVPLLRKQQKPISSKPSAPRVIRSIGPKNLSDGTGNLSSKTAASKVGPIIIKKAGPGTSSSAGSVQGNTLPASSTVSRPVKGGPMPLKKNGSVGSTLPNAAAGDLRSVIAVNNPQRGLISAQNLSFLRRFVTEQGKILSRRLTRVTARQQREITKAIKQARILGYLQFVNTK
jgi:small subunit ribosomal protein S18